MSTQDPNIPNDDTDDDDGDDVTTTAPTAAPTSLLTVPTASVSIPGASVGTIGITVLPGGSTTTVTLATATGGAAVTRTVTGITGTPTTTATNGTSTDSSSSGGGGLSQSAKIAIGVSVPLGILILLLLIYGAYRMGGRRHGGSSPTRLGFLGALFQRSSSSPGGAGAAATASSPKSLVPSDDAEKAMLEKQTPSGPVELATGPDVPELPTAVNYQELAAGDPWEAKRAFEARQMYNRSPAAADDDRQAPRSQDMLGGAGVAGGAAAARQVSYGMNMNRKPVAGTAGGVRRGAGSQASSSSAAGGCGPGHSPISPARTASQSHHSSSEPMSSISPMSSNSPMMPVELPGDTGPARRDNG